MLGFLMFLGGSKEGSGKKTMSSWDAMFFFFPDFCKFLVEVKEYSKRLQIVKG